MPALPSEQGVGTIEYPLTYIFKPGYSGNIQFSKLSDGTSKATIKIIGAKLSSRYFGKITKSNALDNQSTFDLADLNELDPKTGTSVTWVQKNYNNQAILFDTLVNSNSMVRVLELNEENKLSEILRGDIGSNLLTNEKKTYNLIQYKNSGIEGSITFQKRLNGKYVLKSELQRLDTNNNGFYILSIYSGDLSTGQYTRTQKIAAISPLSSITEISVNNLTSNLSELDNLAGFWGLATSDFRSDSVVAYHNFRGNTSTGRTTEYDVFKEAVGNANIESDTIVAKIKFEERPGGKVRTTITSLSFPSTDDYYLIFSKGTTLFQPVNKPFNAIRIQNNSSIIVDGLAKDSSSQELLYEDIANWDAHCRITTDTTNITSTYGLANLGGNEFSSESKTITISPLNASICEGSLLLRKRKNGNASGQLNLTYREPFTDHIFSLRQGTTSTASTNDPLLIDIIRIDGGNGGDVKANFDFLMKFQNNETITYANLLAATGYFEFAILDGGNDLDRRPLAAGDNL